VPSVDPCKGVFEPPTPRPMVYRVELVRTEFESKLGIPYENGRLVALYVNIAVVIFDDRTIPLPKVEGAETTMVQAGEGGLGGGIPPMVVGV
jgi:hypothetical protein